MLEDSGARKMFEIAKKVREGLDYRHGQHHTSS